MDAVAVEWGAAQGEEGEAVMEDMTVERRCATCGAVVWWTPAEEEQDGVVFAVVCGACMEAWGENIAFNVHWPDWEALVERWTKEDDPPRPS